MGRGLGVIGFPNVNAFKDRHGKIRYRYRRTGQKDVYLHGVPGSPQFAAEYEAACSGRTTTLTPGAHRTAPGTIDALAVAIYASAEWRQLSKSTQTTYRGIIERLRTDYGHGSVRALQAQHILKMRDKKADAPTAANNLVKVVRWMLAFAVARQWRADNPAIGIKPLKIVSAGFPVWTEDDIASFEQHWAVGSRERLAFDLLLYTAQRSGDVRQMGRQHVQGAAILVRQEKTKAFLELPIHPRLAASLETVPSGQMLFLVTQGGAGFTAGGFGNWFRDACREAGIMDRSAHGLRKSAATRLADAGCTEAQIKAVTGHKTSKEVERYTKARDQKRLAKDAFALIGGTQGEQILANQTGKLAKQANN
nr:tyrosine-type recombinase/integrase [uncultured Brevundimonas sp.]